MKIDLGKFDSSKLKRDDVKILVERMYTTLDANEIIRGLFASADRTFIVSCLGGLSEDPNLDIACNAVEMLVSLEGTNAIHWVAKLLDNEDDLVRCAGCRLLSRLDCPEARAYLIQCLQNDKSGNVRFNAAESLEAIGDLSTIEVLNHAAESDCGTDFEGRPISERALRSIGTILRRQQSPEPS